MTNEEAKKVLDAMYGDWRTDEEREALEVAISLIVGIEDIKAEIETEIQDCTAQWHDAWWNGRKDGLRDALEIVDKYISGKENG